MKKPLAFILILTGLILNTQAYAIDQHLVFNKTSNSISERSILDYNWQPYIDRITKNLKSNWFPPKNSSDVEVTFKITPDGKYKNLRVTKPSKNKKDNQAALDAVMFTFPMQPAPVAVNEIMVKYTFSYEAKPASNTTALNIVKSVEVVVIN